MRRSANLYQNFKVIMLFICLTTSVLFLCICVIILTKRVNCFEKQMKFMDQQKYQTILTLIETRMHEYYKLLSDDIDKLDKTIVFEMMEINQNFLNFLKEKTPSESPPEVHKKVRVKQLSLNLPETKIEKNSPKT